MEQYDFALLRARSGKFVAQEFQFGDFTLDQARYRLQRGDRLVRLERRPMELLILLVGRHGQLVSREEIAEHLWGKEVFLDVDHGINTAIRKVRQALRDNPEKPRFVETAVGKGYRFAAPVICAMGTTVCSSRQFLLRSRQIPAMRLHQRKRNPTPIILGWYSAQQRTRPARNGCSLVSRAERQTRN
jgi:DNA-binding winged helix-turn-helix (wHTH) protein